MELVEKVLLKPKITRTDLSNVYKQIKQLKLNISWLDLYRKSTRFDSIKELQSKLQINKIDKEEKEHQKIVKKLINAIKETKKDEYVVLTINFKGGLTKYTTITPQSKAKLIKSIKSEIQDDYWYSKFGFSDGMIEGISGKKIESFSLTSKKKFEEIQTNLFKKNKETKITEKRKGGFFPYTHKIKNDFVESVLEELQIYRHGVLPENPDVCFINSIKGQIPEDIIEKIKFEIRTEYISTTTIKRICEQNNIFIKIRHERTTSKNNFSIYGNEDSIFKADICCISKHYFKFIENTNITSYFLKNYEELKNEKEPYKFAKKNKRANGRGLNSFLLVNELLKLKDTILEEVSYDFISQFKSIEVDSSKVYDLDPLKCCREIENKLKENEINVKRIMFDCETYKNKKHKHIPYMVSMIDDDDEVKSFITENCFDEFLNYIANKHGKEKYNKATKLELYAHNSTYDASFMLGKLQNLQILEKDSKYVSVKGHFKSQKGYIVDLLIKDSCRLIPMKLSEIPSACGFSEEAQKEIMYYDMYNYKTIKNIRSMSKSDIMFYINDFEKNSHCSKTESEEKRKTFFNNLDTWRCKNEDDSFDLLKYSQIYCEQDCKVLKKGLQKWYELFKEVDNRINVYQFYSLPSLANYFFKINDCFDGCFEMSGALGKFFNNFVSGGRVCSRDNEKHYVEKNIQDFDAVSLYPSAMYLFQGYLKGTPKRIVSKNYEDIKNYDGYFVKVLVKSVGKEQPIPVLNYMDKKSMSKCWTSNVIDKVLFLDKVGLEDAIEFQKIEFEIIDGYYYNEGFNTKIKESIKHLFDKRLEAKKNKNDSLQMIFKLLMNSSYGKLIQKTPETDIKYIKNEDLLRNVSKNYHYIKCWSDVSKSEYLRMETYRSLDESFSSPHLGSQVLSYSKRLMNRVICLAGDNDMKIYYTDTDSIHIDEECVVPLAGLYKEKYGKELIGKNLGQFHCDFDFKDMKDVRSIGLIVLGKKCYIDKLEGTDKEGNKQYSFHIRLKGVSIDAINQYVNDRKQYNKNYNEWNVYEDLYNGKSILFDLNVNNKVRFQKSKDQEYSTFSGDFKRTISF